ncbi:hypothetical protein PUN28_019207 [Cardiocondyla obscurior]|uniref:Uncharacterized protein n=1 Tax=Cardiocondyla obscurior TaxID=286306 RepID=A0AAW2ECG1_9HYME
MCTIEDAVKDTARKIIPVDQICSCREKFSDKKKKKKNLKKCAMSNLLENGSKVRDGSRCVATDGSDVRFWSQRIRTDCETRCKPTLNRNNLNCNGKQIFLNVNYLDFLFLFFFFNCI